MEETIRGEYLIFGYMGDLEDAIRFAKKNGISGGTIKGIETAHGNLMELGPLLKSEANYKRLKEDVGGLIESLVKSVRESNEDNTLGCVQQLKEKLKMLKSETLV